jgi:hypothetical protein
MRLPISDCRLKAYASIRWQKAEEKEITKDTTEHEGKTWNLSAIFAG